MGRYRSKDCIEKERRIAYSSDYTTGYLKIQRLLHRAWYTITTRLVLFALLTGISVSCSVKKEYDSLFFKDYITSFGYIKNYPNEGDVLVCQHGFKRRLVSSTKIVKQDSSILLENLYKKDVSIKVDVLDSDIFMVLSRSSYGSIMSCNMQIVFSNQDTLEIGSNNLLDLRSNSEIVEIIVPRFGGTVFKGAAAVTSQFYITVTCDFLKREALENYWFGDFEIKDIDTFQLDLLTVENSSLKTCSVQPLKPITVVRDSITEKYAKTWYEPSNDHNSKSN